MTDEQAQRIGRMAQHSEPKAIRLIYATEGRYVVPPGHVGVFLDIEEGFTPYMLLKPDGEAGVLRSSPDIGRDPLHRKRATFRIR